MKNGIKEEYLCDEYFLCVVEVVVKRRISNAVAKKRISGSK